MKNKTFLKLKTQLETQKKTYEEILTRPMSGTKRSTDTLDVARNELQIHSSAFFRKKMDTKLAQINQALRAMEDGTYGMCRITGQSIPLKRLKAVPWSLVSIDAAA